MTEQQQWEKFEADVNRADITPAEKKAILEDARTVGFKQSGNKVPRWKESSLADLHPVFARELQQREQERDKKQEVPPQKDKSSPAAQAASRGETRLQDISLADAEKALAAGAGWKAAGSLEKRFPRTPAQVPPQAPSQMPAQAPAVQAPAQAPAQATAPAAQTPRPSALPITGGPAGPISASPMVQQGGTGTFNYGKAFGLTDVEAGRALDMSKRPGGAQDLIAQRTAGLGRVAQMGGGYVENPLYGGVMTPDTETKRSPRVSFTQTPSGMSQLPPAQPVPTTAPAPTSIPAPSQPGALSRMVEPIKRGVMGVLGSAPVSGVLGGLGTMESYKEYEARQKANDPVGQALAGLGVAGGLAQLAPHPVPKYLGMGASAISPLSLYLLDKYRASARQPYPIDPAHALAAP